MTVSLDKKLFSGGLDLKVMIQGVEHVEVRHLITEFIALLGRMSIVNVPTIAVVHGAAIAGGCMFSFGHDFIYVVERGIFHCNEVELGMPLPPGMFGTIARKHATPNGLRDMAVFGRKFSEKDGLKAGFVDEVVKNLQEVADKASELASFGRNRANFRKLKMEQNKNLIEACIKLQQLPRL